MKNVAVMDEGIVINIILCADDYVLSENEIEYFDENPACIGGDYVDGFFYVIQPFPSWSRLNGQWIPPVPIPENMMELNPDNLPVTWDEENQNWLIG